MENKPIKKSWKRFSLRTLLMATLAAGAAEYFALLPFTKGAYAYNEAAQIVAEEAPVEEEHMPVPKDAREAAGQFKHTNDLGLSLLDYSRDIRDEESWKTKYFSRLYAHTPKEVGNLYEQLRDVNDRNLVVFLRKQGFRTDDTKVPLRIFSKEYRTGESSLEDETESFPHMFPKKDGKGIEVYFLPFRAGQGSTRDEFKKWIKSIGRPAKPAFVIDSEKNQVIPREALHEGGD